MRRAVVLLRRGVVPPVSPCALGRSLAPAGKDAVKEWPPRAMTERGRRQAVISGRSKRARTCWRDHYGGFMTLPSEPWVQPGIEHAASSEAWLRHTLEEILSQIRVLLDIDGCAFQIVDLERSHIFLAASWFETAAMRATMQPILERTYDPDRGGVTEAAVERGEPILIRDVEAWRGAGALRARLRNQLDPESAESAWEWYRTSTFISCPVRTAGGRTLGVLALSSSPPRPPLSDEHLRVTEVFASLAALALERSELLEREARRARTEETLHGAAQEMTASLDLDAVYAAI